MYIVHTIMTIKCTNGVKILLKCINKYQLIKIHLAWVMYNVFMPDIQLLRRTIHEFFCRHRKRISSKSKSKPLPHELNKVHFLCRPETTTVKCNTETSERSKFIVHRTMIKSAKINSFI